MYDLLVIAKAVVDLLAELLAGIIALLEQFKQLFS